ncbi:MAG: bifunctional phosphoglucose/phosphomannose isomerase [Candidatus Heimdallarchaeota archaeon]
MDLNNMAQIKEYDPQNMLNQVYRLPDMIEELLSRDFTIPSQIETNRFQVLYGGRPNNIIICGMGGSAVSGDYIKAIFPLKIPVTVTRNYRLPTFAGKDTLVCFVSYSGNTEETLSCLLFALEKRCRVVGISSGGYIARFFEENSLPYFEIPPGFQPRAAFPLIFFALAKILQSFDLISLQKTVIDEILYILRDIRDQCRLDISLPENSAKNTAMKLFQKIPVVWAPYRCIANRIKCQFNENSKMLAISEELPELNHNHIVGWEGYEKNDYPFLVLVIRFPTEHSNVRLRFEISKRIVKPKCELIEIHTRGTHLLSQLLSITYLFDFISIYLAMLNHRDPSTVDSIDYLKRELEEREQTQSKVIEALQRFI